MGAGLGGRPRQAWEATRWQLPPGSAEGDRDYCAGDHDHGHCHKRRRFQLFTHEREPTIES
jgi:hypothetical protein